MKIRIVKASSPTFWYADKIGEVYDTRTMGVSLYAKYNESFKRVLAEDCEEVIEHNSQLYRKVDRPVREGDTVLITEFKPHLHVTAFRDVNNGDVFKVKYVYGKGSVDTGGVNLHDGEYTVLEPIESPPTLTDLVANLAQEVAELKKRLENVEAGVEVVGKSNDWSHTRITNLKKTVVENKTDITDLEDRLDENEKDTEEVQQNVAEVIGRINDLGDGAEAAAVVPVEVIEKVIAELRKRKDEAIEAAKSYKDNGYKHSHYRKGGISIGLSYAINAFEEVLRND